MISSPGRSRRWPIDPLHTHPRGWRDYGNHGTVCCTCINMATRSCSISGIWVFSTTMCLASICESRIAKSGFHAGRQYRGRWLPRRRLRGSVSARSNPKRESMAAAGARRRGSPRRLRCQCRDLVAEIPATLSSKPPHHAVQATKSSCTGKRSQKNKGLATSRNPSG
jgi:hypothetical protein